MADLRSLGVFFRVARLRSFRCSAEPLAELAEEVAAEAGHR
ncbi:hypothetical protein SAMN02745775_1011326 [Falsiroseomonas stagni DSM 19981]|uniref:Uncharacterized protein n=1 Tax=Falsiroseomonas stagni DSM 19981 TaxID=1123062 RepID=A0A1I3YH62_9PROT|nr:hypothetical protein SAMN02745775_1011326 [Falsiroseomonas stagni DSM 19981]